MTGVRAAMRDRINDDLIERELRLVSVRPAPPPCGSGDCHGKQQGASLQCVRSLSRQ